MIGKLTRGRKYLDSIYTSSDGENPTINDIKLKVIFIIN